MRAIMCHRTLLSGLLSISLTLAGASGQDVEREGAALLSRFDPVSKRLDTRMAEVTDELSRLARIPQEQTGERIGYHSRIQQGGQESLWVQVDLGAVVEFDTVVLVPVVLPKEQGGIEGYGFPEGFRLDLSDTPDQASAITLEDRTQTPVMNPGRCPIVIACTGAKGRYLRLTATAPAGWRGKSGRVSWPSLALAEIMVLRGDRNLAAGRTVSAPTSREAPPVWSLQNLTDSESILGPPVSSQTVPRRGWHSEAYADAATPVNITMDLGQAMPLEDVRLFPIRWEGYPHWVGFGFPVRFRVTAAMEPSFVEEKRIAEFTDADFPNPGINPVVMPADGITARYVRLTATRQWERFTDHAVALAEMQVYSNGRNVAHDASLTTTSVYPAQEWSNDFLHDGNSGDNPILPLPEWIAQLKRSSALEKELATLELQRRAREGALQALLVRGGVSMGLLAFAVPLVFLVRASLRRRRELRQLRERIARDLHDEVGSNLAGIALLSREASRAPESQREALIEEIRQVAEETSGSMRDLVWMIQPGTAGDIVAGLRTLAERMLKSRSLVFHPPAATWRDTLSLDAKRELYLMSKEVLQNVVKHSDATEVTLSINPRARELMISIADNGKGFVLGAAVTGFGLANLRTRAEQLGGRCAIEAQPGQGTMVSISVPLV